MSDIRKRTGKKGTTYQVRYADESSPTGFAYKTFETMKAARAHREGPKIEARPRNALSVFDAVDQWLLVCEKEGRDGRPPVSAATLTVYRYIAEHIKAYRWDKPVQSLSKQEVIAFRSWLLQERTRYIAAKTLTYFHAVMAEMETRGRIGSNPANGVNVQMETRYSQAVDIPSEAEVGAILRAADSLANSPNAQVARTWERYRPMIYLATDSGMRPQELLAVGGSSLAPAGIHVERAIDRGGELSVTKTRAGRRFIDLSPETIEMVAHYRDTKSLQNDYDLIFPTANGLWQSQDNWRKRCFHAALERAGLVRVERKDGKDETIPKYTPYALRHYFASSLIADGVSIARITSLMGHTKISTTFDVYAHLIEHMEDRRTLRTGLVQSLARQ